jgi:cobalt-zinc-cadmium efflux system membrane fusion protein
MSCGTNSDRVAVDRQAYIIPDSLLKTLTIDSVRQEQLVNAITLTGQVDFNQDNVVNIFPMISGNVQGIKVVLGDYVEKGQALGVIASPEMAQYSSDILNAETNLRLAELSLDKTKDLYSSGLASKADSLSAEVSVQQARAEVLRSQRVLKINGGSTQGEYTIKAPISGFIVQKMVTNDQVIRTDNGTNMFTISDLKNVWVWANVYESNTNKIHMGDSVDITTLSYPGRVFRGKVDKIMHVLDAASKVMKVRVAIDNADYALRPQMFASVTVTNTQHQQAIDVPSSAVIFDHSQYYVLVYSGEGKAAITPVEKLNVLGDKTYLTGGVTKGQRVIASDAIQIYDQLNN